MTRKLLYVVIIVFSLQSVSIAAPTITNISGTLTNGEQVTVSGSGFSNKAQAAPLVSSYDNSSSANNWSNGSIGGLWSIGASATVTLSNSSPRTQMIQSRYKLSYDASGAYDSVRYLHSRVEDKIYVSFWMYRDNDIMDLSGTGMNSKFFRVYISGGVGDANLVWSVVDNESSGYDIYKSYASGDYLGNNSGWRVDYTANVANASKGNSNYFFVQSKETAAMPRMRRWEHYEILIDYPSSFGATDGRVVQLKDGCTFAVSSNIMMGESGQTQDRRHILIGQVSGGRNSSYNEYIDEVYIDNTPAHVYISDSQDASWPEINSFNHSEIQVASNWGDSSLTFTMNQGSFTNGQNVYLYIVDNNGVCNSVGYPLTIGNTNSGPPPEEPDQAPTVSITQPSSQATYTSEDNQVTLMGSASDDTGITSITWQDNHSGSGTATGTNSWSIDNLTLAEGENVITVTATDTNNQTSSDTITITYLPGESMLQAWSAEEEAGETGWSNSTATWCLRVPITGSNVTQSGDHVVIVFKGRTSANYQIKKVSIAQRDINGGEGDVIDSTWKRVTFDGQAEDSWNTYETTVSAGTEKLSDSIPFSFVAGNDYYVTFQLVSPSVYLCPSTGYSEFYFDSTDHTEDIDWANNGHSIAEARLHGISKIYVSNEGGGGGSEPLDAPELEIVIPPS